MIEKSQQKLHSLCLMDASHSISLLLANLLLLVVGLTITRRDFTNKVTNNLIYGARCRELASPERQGATSLCINCPQ